jgi:hypothetical protein
MIQSDKIRGRKIEENQNSRQMQGARPHTSQWLVKWAIKDQQIKQLNSGCCVSERTAGGGR